MIGSVAAVVDTELTNAIRTQVPAANVDAKGRLGAALQPAGKGAFIDLKMSFIQHRIVKESEASGLKESMVLVVSHSQKGVLTDVFNQELPFETRWFDNLIQMPDDDPRRRMEKVYLAKEVLGDLL